MQANPTIERAWNPFHSEVVESPWSAPETDVPSIHQDSFERCCELFDLVRAGQGPQALFLYGPAGCGKTHLLSRFRRYVEQFAEATPPAALVAVRIDCSAARLWRHLRANLFRDLTTPRGKTGFPPLRRLLAQAKQRHAGAGDWNTALDRAGASYNLATALDAYHAQKFIPQAKAWLRGEALTEKHLERLEIAPEDEDADGENEAKKLVEAVVKVFAPATFAFCFDQLEALQDPYEEHRGLAAFGGMAGELSERPNVFVVSSTLTSYIDDLQQAIPRSFYQRLSKHQRQVATLELEEARRLLEARLDLAPELRERPAENPLRPLEWCRVEKLFESQNGVCTARKLIHEAGVWFDEACGNPPEERPTLEQRLEEALAERQEQALENPAATYDVLVQGLERVSELTGRRYWKPGSPSVVDCSLGPEGRAVALAVCDQRNSNSLAARLRRLVGLSASERARLRLLRPAAQPISAAAKKTHQRLEKLAKSGARLVRPSAEALAALDACRRLLNDAQTGNLAFEGDAFGPATVRQWLAGNLPQSVRDLCDEILEGDANPVETPLLELLAERPVMRAADAASTLNFSEESLISYARAHPDTVGFLGGPPVVLFREAAAGGDRGSA